MKHYLNHIKSLYVRPTLNGIDGNMELRAASPFELFLDLIFVIALSKLGSLFEAQTIVSFLEATLLFTIIYSLWHTMTTYTVMFMKKETNYWTRAMVFIVLLPLIFFLGIDNLNTSKNIMVFCFSLATSKILLSIIFRDSIVNAPLNNITTSNLYLMISRNQLISAILLLIAGLVQNKLIFITLLVIISFREIVIISRKKNTIIKKSFAPLLINKQLFMERQLLFIILIFGESLVSIVTKLATNFNMNSFIHIAIVFAIMFLFYVRISEETEYNSTLIAHSDHLFTWLLNDYIIFVLFVQLSSIPELVAEHGKLPLFNLVTLIFVLLFTSLQHMNINQKNWSDITDPIESVYHNLEHKTLVAMTIVALLLIPFHGSVTVIYLLIFTFFLLHVLALPFRRHLIEDKCNFANHVTEQSQRTNHKQRKSSR